MWVGSAWGMCAHVPFHVVSQKHVSTMKFAIARMNKQSMVSTILCTCKYVRTYDSGSAGLRVCELAYLIQAVEDEQAACLVERRHGFGFGLAGRITRGFGLAGSSSAASAAASQYAADACEACAWVGVSRCRATCTPGVAFGH